MKRVACMLLLATVLLGGTALAQPQEAHLVIELTAESVAALPLGDVVLMPGDQHAFTLTMAEGDDDMTIGEALEALDPVNGPAAMGRSTLSLPGSDLPLDAEDTLKSTTHNLAVHIKMRIMQELPPAPPKIASDTAVAGATPEPYVPRAIVARKSALYAQPDSDSFLRSVPEGTGVEVVAWGIGPGGQWHRIVVGSDAYYILSENLNEI